MTTVVNTPANNGESTGTGFVIGVVVVIIVLLGLLFVYGVPALRGTTHSANINVNLPTGGTTGGGTTGGGATGQ